MSEPLPIDAPRGTKAVYANPDGGYDPQTALGRKHLTLGETYTVEHTEIHDWHTDVFLEERPGIGFNSALFDTED